MRSLAVLWVLVPASVGAGTVFESEFRPVEDVDSEAALEIRLANGNSSSDVSILDLCEGDAGVLSLRYDEPLAELVLDDLRLCGSAVSFFDDRLVATSLELVAGGSGGFAPGTAAVEADGSFLLEGLPFRVSGRVTYQGGAPRDTEGLDDLDLAGRIALDAPAGRYRLEELAGGFGELPLPFAGARLSGTLFLELESRERIPGPIFASGFESGDFAGWQLGPDPAGPLG